jgi:hypothetical protein
MLTFESFYYNFVIQEATGFGGYPGKIADRETYLSDPAVITALNEVQRKYGGITIFSLPYTFNFENELIKYGYKIKRIYGVEGISDNLKESVIPTAKNIVTNNEDIDILLPFNTKTNNFVTKRISDVLANKLPITSTSQFFKSVKNEGEVVDQNKVKFNVADLDYVGPATTVNVKNDISNAVLKLEDGGILFVTYKLNSQVSKEYQFLKGVKEIADAQYSEGYEELFPQGSKQGTENKYNFKNIPKKEWDQTVERYKMYASNIMEGIVKQDSQLTPIYINVYRGGKNASSASRMVRMCFVKNTNFVTQQDVTTPQKQDIGFKEFEPVYPEIDHEEELKKYLTEIAEKVTTQHPNSITQDEYETLVIKIAAAEGDDEPTHSALTQAVDTFKHNNPSILTYLRNEDLDDEFDKNQLWLETIYGNKFKNLEVNQTYTFKPEEKIIVTSITNALNKLATNDETLGVKYFKIKYPGGIEHQSGVTPISITRLAEPKQVFNHDTVKAIIKFCNDNNNEIPYVFDDKYMPIESAFYRTIQEMNINIKHFKLGRVKKPGTTYNRIKTVLYLKDAPESTVPAASESSLGIELKAMKPGDIHKFKKSKAVAYVKQLIQPQKLIDYEVEYTTDNKQKIIKLTRRAEEQITTAEKESVFRSGSKVKAVADIIRQLPDLEHNTYNFDESDLRGITSTTVDDAIKEVSKELNISADKIKSHFEIVRKSKVRRNAVSSVIYHKEPRELPLITRGRPRKDKSQFEVVREALMKVYGGGFAKGLMEL